jgi:hypothetical protein
MSKLSPGSKHRKPKVVGEVRPISDLGITPESTRLTGTIPVGGKGIKGAIKYGAKAVKYIRKKIKNKK